MSASSSSSSWSIEDYCATQTALALEQQQAWTSLPASSQAFLQALSLPTVHPFCTQFGPNGPNDWHEYYNPYHGDNGTIATATSTTTTTATSTSTSSSTMMMMMMIPRQGPLHVTAAVHENVWQATVTLLTMLVPPLLAMLELWLRLLASVIAPVGILVLLFLLLRRTKPTTKNNNNNNNNYKSLDVSSYIIVRGLDVICLLGTAASVVLLTDTLYVLEWGPLVGATCLMGITILTGCAHRRYKLSRQTVYATFALWALTGHLITNNNNNNNNNNSNSGWTFGNPDDIVAPTLARDGLYYSTDNDAVRDIVQSWLTTTDAHQYHDQATPWMPTGDARTGLPFLLHHVALPSYTRVWLPVVDDNPTTTTEEYVALDIALPRTGHDVTQPLYLVLHGLNGGSAEEYVRDFVWRQTQNNNATVVVMVARGLMDTPVRGWNNFHGARWTDAAAAANALRAALSSSSSTSSTQQALVGVGYSMGAIVLSNMVVQTGTDCALDAAVAISGGLDMRQQQNFQRAQRLWQPLLTKELRQTFLLGKWGERVRARLSHETFLAMLRATHITGIDASAVVSYNGFRDVVDYYEQMSALGDIPLHEELLNASATVAPDRQLHQLSVPLLVVHALDDPLISWRTVASNRGPMHPSNLTKTGKGNLLILLTKRGGHVGWPTGWFPQLHTWHWMNHVPATFAASVQQNKQRKAQEVEMEAATKEF